MLSPVEQQERSRSPPANRFVEMILKWTAMIHFAASDHFQRVTPLLRRVGFGSLPWATHLQIVARETS
jgi:hypothetical protein